MRTEISFIGASTRNRVLVIIGVIALSLWMIYPIQNSLKLGLDLNGGVQLVLRVKTEDPLHRAGAARRDRRAGLRTIDRRVNELGVAESVIARYTAADQILVQLPGVSDVDRAKQIIKSTAQLRLTLVDQGPFASRDAALLAYNNALPADLEILPGQADRGEPGDPLFYVVQRAPAITGNDLRSARQSLDEFNRPAVGFTLKPDAARRFGAITERNINRPLATVLDNRVMSVATIQSRIDDSGTDRRRQPGGDDRAGHQPELGRAARGSGVCRGAHGRREPWRRVDSRRRAGVARRPRPRPAVHARPTTAWPASTRSSRWC